MKTFLCFLLSTAIVSSGCTHTYSSGPYAKAPDVPLHELHPRLFHHNVTIYFLDGTEVSGTEVLVGSDSTFWHDKATNARMAVSTRNIHKVTVRNGVRGFLEGLLMGLPVSAAILFLGFLSWKAKTFQTALAVSLFALPGFPIAGIFLGKEEYVINP